MLLGLSDRGGTLIIEYCLIRQPVEKGGDAYGRVPKEIAVAIPRGERKEPWPGARNVIARRPDPERSEGEGTRETILKGSLHNEAGLKSKVS